ncbi:MAG: ABC transporter ATP-binding protein, partial [Actinomycetota bacterium]|nr:ABC transporter ATP-binding protein [Actinomycetota bacterium]
MIEIRDLTKRYGSTEVVKNFSLSIPEGESVALWGPNGAGKTTVVRCILGLVAYEGSIEVAGFDARSRGKAARSLMGYVPQELSFYDDMSVVNLLDYSASLRGIGTERVDDVVELVDLENHRDKQVRELSGGLKQRLGLASALLPDPPILLLDEPTSNLDARARDAAIRLFEGLRSTGRTMIVTSHHMEEVGMLVDRVVAMEDGEITVECDPTELADRLGLRAWLHLIVPSDNADRALNVL